MDFFFLGIEESLGSDNKFVKLNNLLDFECFRGALKGIYIQESTNRGRPSYDSVKMFKLLLLGQWHGLSDRELADSLKLRLDFLYFTGFTPTANLPDYSSICKFRNLLVRKNKLSLLLENLNQQLTNLGLNICHAKGAIIEKKIKLAHIRLHMVKTLMHNGLKKAERAIMDIRFLQAWMMNMVLSKLFIQSQLKSMRVTDLKRC